jgi:hypothetical protein
MAPVAGAAPDTQPDGLVLIFGLLKRDRQVVDGVKIIVIPR